METEEDVKMMSEAEEPRHRCSFVAVDKEGICKHFQEKENLETLDIRQK